MAVVEDLSSSNMDLLAKTQLSEHTLSQDRSFGGNVSRLKNLFLSSESNEPLLTEPMAPHRLKSRIATFRDVLPNEQSVEIAPPRFPARSGQFAGIKSSPEIRRKREMETAKTNGSAKHSALVNAVQVSLKSAEQVTCSTSTPSTNTSSPVSKSSLPTSITAQLAVGNTKHFQSKEVLKSSVVGIDNHSQAALKNAPCVSIGKEVDSHAPLKIASTNTVLGKNSSNMASHTASSADVRCAERVAPKSTTHVERRFSNDENVPETSHSASPPPSSSSEENSDSIKPSSTVDHVERFRNTRALFEKLKDQNDQKESPVVSQYT